MNEPTRASHPVPAPVSTDRLTRFSQFIGRVIPDAMSTAVGMLVLLALGPLPSASGLLRYQAKDRLLAFLDRL